MNKARIDLISAKVLFDAGLTDPACYHCQQSAEKHLKGIIEEHGQAIPRTHDLLTLIDIILPHVSIPDFIRDAAAMLNVYAIEIRYPGTDAGLEDAKDAIAKAEMVEHWVLLLMTQNDA